jgi:hypothetical protein
MLALWSLLLWERKVRRVALERSGVDPSNLARALDQLLDERSFENPVAHDPGRQLWLVKTGETYWGWDFEGLLEPLVREAEHEALELAHNYVGAEHLLLAIVRLSDEPQAGLLSLHGIEHDGVREAVLGVLQS